MMMMMVAVPLTILAHHDGVIFLYCLALCRAAMKTRMRMKSRDGMTCCGVSHSSQNDGGDDEHVYL